LIGCLIGSERGYRLFTTEPIQPQSGEGREAPPKTARLFPTKSNTNVATGEGKREEELEGEKWERETNKGKCGRPNVKLPNLIVQYEQQRKKEKHQ
jgi:hypothetical protein